MHFISELRDKYLHFFSLFIEADQILIEKGIITDDDPTKLFAFKFLVTFSNYIYSIIISDGVIDYSKYLDVCQFLDLEDEDYIDFVETVQSKKESGFLDDFEILGEFAKGIHLVENTGNKDYFEKIFNFMMTIGAFFSIKDANSEQEIPLIAAKYLSVIKSFYEQLSLAADKFKEKQNKNLKKSNIDDLIGELNSLIGLEKVKNEVNSLINQVKISKLKQERGFVVPQKSLHLVFTGNPGTGKTTVARLISKIYQSLGFLSKGHLIETDRSGLVAGYVGQTALKVQDIVSNALGGVLFIDEAYSLFSKDSSNDYGSEAINTLIKLMEDNRDDLIVIVAGYPDKMEDFIQSNPGLKSRFNKYIEFPDYNSEELICIFNKMSFEHQLNYSDEIINYLKLMFSEIYEKRDKNFGNGRDVRNIFEHCISNQANRLAQLENISNSVLSELNIDDLKFGFQNYFDTLDRNSIKIKASNNEPR